ncbi:uncharacterized protein LOC111350741 [Spodoptera litura]|uniref:Uncharacterized protein LOC111350741 n=1 Tax=Spodoptera litura TaxID=69820 RepID=A0A9J7DXM9_SPOLT|nr:uncharacterized protein LOC111350741 [Spodoptera litura]
MKVPIFIFALIISYVLGDSIKYAEKKFPKKVRPYGSGKILINSKYESKAKTKPKSAVSPPTAAAKTYTVFQIVSHGMSKMVQGVPDSPYFPIDEGFNHKSRVKKILPDYAWAAGRVKRGAVNEKISTTTTDNKTEAEQKPTPLPKTTVSQSQKQPGKVESPSMRSQPEKAVGAKEVKKETTVTTKAEKKTDIKKQAAQVNAAKTNKNNESKTADKLKTTTKSKIKPTKAKPKGVRKGVSGKNTTGKLKSANAKTKPKGKGAKRTSKPKAKKLANANKPKANGTAKGTGSKNKKKDNKRNGGKSPQRSKGQGNGKSKAKKSAKSKSNNATRTAAKKPKATRRLIAAREAVIEDYPYVVSIQKDDQHWCTGALLNPRLVITTANCLWKANRVSRMEVRAGSRYIDRGGQMAAIQEVMKHPGWGLRKSPDNDVALLLLDRNIKFSDSVHGIDLPNRVMLPPFDDAWVTSWGSERRDGIYDSESSTLQVYHTRLMNHDKCNNVTMRFSVIVSENFICLAQSGRSGPCTRDTGAPAVSDGILWGLASWGIRKLCGTERFPSMFSYLASHSNLDFIANATRFLMADKRYYPFVDRFPNLN